jgi:ankyrin repeat protein
LWNPDQQSQTIAVLLQAGADPNAEDRNGATPLYRAVRCGSAAAARALLHGGADPHHRNKTGSTPIALANQNTGRGGTASVDANVQHSEVLRLLEGYRA